MTIPPSCRFERNKHSLYRFLPLSFATLLAASDCNLRGDATWNSNSGGVWSNPTNWSTDPAIPNGQDTTILFDVATASRNITLDGNYTVGNITFNSPFGDNLLNGNLTLSASSGNATITMNDVFTRYGIGDTISSPLFLSSPTVIINNNAPINSSYTLVVSGNVTGNQPLSFVGPGYAIFTGNCAGFTGPLSVSGSSVTFSNLTNLNALGSPTININAGGTLHVTAAVTIADKSITLNGGTLSATTDAPLTFTKPINVIADGTLAGSIYDTITPSLTGSGNLTLLGGNFTCSALGAANTYTGNITLASVRLNISGSLVHSQISLSDRSILTLNRPVGNDPSVNGVAPASIHATGGALALGANIDFRPALAPDATPSAILFNIPDATLAGSNSLDMNAFANPTTLRIGGNGSIASTMDIRPDLSTHTFRFGLATSGIAGSALTVKSILADHDAAPANLDLAGPNTLTLTAANSYSGSTSVAATGSLFLNAAGALPAGSPIINNGNITANANSTSGNISGLGLLSLANNITFTLAPNSGASKQGALTLGTMSRFNLTNNPLIIEPANASAKSSDLVQLAAQISTARNGGLWNRPGITSSTVAANPSQLTIVLADNALALFSAYGGQSVDTNSLLIVPTWFGDANLDGHVDLTDLSAVLNNFGSTSSAWTDGNFDNAPTIDLTDLSAVLNNFGLSFPAASTGLQMTNDDSPIPTPEPASLLLIFATALLPITRRSRRAKEARA